MVRGDGGRKTTGPREGGSGVVLGLTSLLRTALWSERPFVVTLIINIITRVCFGMLIEVSGLIYSFFSKMINYNQISK